MLIEFQRLEEAIVEDMPRDLEGPTDDLVEVGLLETDRLVVSGEWPLGEPGDRWDRLRRVAAKKRRRVMAWATAVRDMQQETRPGTQSSPNGSGSPGSSGPSPRGVLRSEEEVQRMVEAAIAAALAGRDPISKGDGSTGCDPPASLREAVELARVTHSFGQHPARRVEPWEFELVDDRFPACRQEQCGLEELPEGKKPSGSDGEDSESEERKRAAAKARFGSLRTATDEELRRALDGSLAVKDIARPPEWRLDSKRGLVLEAKAKHCRTFDEWDEIFTVLMCKAPEEARDLLLHFRKWMRLMSLDYSWDHLRKFYDYLCDQPADAEPKEGAQRDRGGAGDGKGRDAVKTAGAPLPAVPLSAPAVPPAGTGRKLESLLGLLAFCAQVVWRLSLYTREGLALVAATSGMSRVAAVGVDAGEELLEELAVAVERYQDGALCPVEALRRLMLDTGDLLEEAPLFHVEGRGKRGALVPMSHAVLVAGLKKLAEQAGLDPARFRAEPGVYSGFRVAAERELVHGASGGEEEDEGRTVTLTHAQLMDLLDMAVAKAAAAAGGALVAPAGGTSASGTALEAHAFPELAWARPILEEEGCDIDELPAGEEASLEDWSTRVLAGAGSPGVVLTPGRRGELAAAAAGLRTVTEEQLQQTLMGTLSPEAVPKPAGVPSSGWYSDL
ncbi:hypothetical protein CYMTET_10451 [Cymbomonas tetramitiformis]|uniref:Uncharacterized protein n=1 Tax=Cymbomonas tetramitiformis TaxID=36881 RepID=A0AAE0GQP6_9CHLO|nr:hypothetical protein CYMTET_10451 [Cymbomonas tetramitiformis]